MSEQTLELEDVIGAIAASYDAGRMIDSLSSAQLPNKRQVIEALQHLKAVMYLGYYATGTLDRPKVPFAIGAHLYPACDILTEQIRRAVGYEGFRATGGPKDAGWPRRTMLEVLAEIPRLRELLSKDVLAAFQGDPAANGIEEVIFSYPSIDAVTVYRIAHEFHRRGVPMLPRIMTEWAHSESGIDIHPGAEIGESFFIDHGTGVVIGETSGIGNRVKLYQGVTLGAISTERSPASGSDAKRHPTLEDDVTIYAHATILGGATIIGAGSVVGGNVFLTESVPAGSRITHSTPTR